MSSVMGSVVKLNYREHRALTMVSFMKLNPQDHWALQTTLITLHMPRLGLKKIHKVGPGWGLEDMHLITTISPHSKFMVF